MNQAALVSSAERMDNIKYTIKYLGINDRRRINLFLKKSKEKIHSAHIEQLQQQTFSVYISYLLNDPQGSERIHTYINLFEEGMRGNTDAFIADQKYIGRVRALEGYTIFDISNFIMPFRNALRRTIKEYNEEADANDRLDSEDVLYMQQFLDYSWLIIARSMIDTRSETIDRNRTQLESLQHCASCMISSSNEERICTIAIQGIASIFNLAGTFWIYKEETLKSLELESAKSSHIPEAVVKIVVRKAEELSTRTAVAIDKNKKPVYLNGEVQEECFEYIGAPIMNQQHILMGIVFIHDQGRSFRFSKFDINLLNQFSYFVGVILGNSRMAKEIENKREELSFLAGRLISIQEEERKRIAADIHDTVTQALSGIGYKALYCQKLAIHNPSRLYEEFTKLQDNINHALHQCRHMIEELRPPSLDDLGIIVAFKKFIHDFIEEEKIEVSFMHAKAIDVDSDQGIVLFRILQEALRNISQHAMASKVDVRLFLHDNDHIYLKVADNGKGFERKDRKISSGGMGLILMRERVEDMGGKFKINAEPEQGCVIEAIIPIGNGVNRDKSKSYDS